MYEVELKVRWDHDRVRERLEEVGGTALGTVTQEDTYFDAPDREFARTDEALRVRRERLPDGDRRVSLTYKGPLVDDQSKTREEAETRVEDEAAIRAILDGLGYEAAATVRKERERYAIDDCTITLDTVDGLGEFVEVEIESDGAIEASGTDPSEAIPALREEAIAVMDRLGLDPGEQIRTSYLGLLLADAD